MSSRPMSQRLCVNCGQLCYQSPNCPKKSVNDVTTAAGSGNGVASSTGGTAGRIFCIESDGWFHARLMPKGLSIGDFVVTKKAPRLAVPTTFVKLDDDNGEDDIMEIICHEKSPGQRKT